MVQHALSLHHSGVQCRHIQRQRNLWEVPGETLQDISLQVLLKTHETLPICSAMVTHQTLPVQVRSLSSLGHELMVISGSPPDHVSRQEREGAKELMEASDPR